MSSSIRALLTLATLTLAVACAAPGPSNGTLSRATAEERLAGLQRLATQHHTQEGLEVSFSTNELHTHKVVMRNCVVRFTKDETTVAAAECEANEGKFTFRGSPVLKTGSLIKLGDQEAVINVTPKPDHHYTVTTTGTGKVESFPK